METNKYPFGQGVLYQTLTMLLLNCTKFMAQFTSFKSKYNNDYVVALQGEVNAAQQMKSQQARSLEHEAVRFDMLPMAEELRDLWQALKRYISEAYGPTQEVANYGAAGWSHYEESVHSWEKLIEMCTMATTYMEEHAGTLKDVGYMPDDFPANFNEKAQVMADTYHNFLSKIELAMEGTAAKIAANNAIYDKIVSLCLDGQVIFKRDEVKRKQFSMEAVSELVKPVGAAGLKGTVTKNGIPQAGLIVELENGSLHVLTDVDGAFDFGNRIASGDDTLIVRNGDEILSEGEINIPAGVTKRENVVLPVTPVIEMSAPIPPTV